MNQPHLSNFDIKGPDVLADVRAALLELEGKIRSGVATSCESIFANFPQVLLDKEAVLEVIYTEFVLRQELGQEASTKEWIGRFPQWSRDLEELFQVHDLVSQDAPFGELSDSQSGLASWIEGTDTQLSRPRIGNYEIINEIGRGSMGTVFLARHRTLGREVALKTVNERDAETPQVLERFRIEAEASAKLQHPNIVQIYEVGVHDRVPFFAMEYVASGNLAQAIHFRPINARDAARLTESLARAIHFAHLQGIVHRDLKPANILLAPSDRPIAVKLELAKGAPVNETANGYEPKVTDFGLAKRLDLDSQQTLPGHAIGTPSYMAPEQTGNGAQAIGPPSDIYSLGAVLYDMLVGRPPFLAPTVAETLNKVMHEEPISICSLQAHVPRDLETICLKCLEKDSTRRYVTANDLADDLQRFLLGKPILARPAGPVERAIKFMRRHPLFTVFLVTLTLGVLAFASQWWRAERHRTTAERETLKAIAARENEFAERQRLERVLYAHDISLAKLEYLSNRTTRSKDLLSKWSSNQMQWEWRYLRRTCQNEICDVDELKSPCRSVAISPDGKLVAAATAFWGIDRECEIKIWRIDSKELLWTFKGHSSSIMDVDFSPDGNYLASIGTRWKANKPLGGLNVWDVHSGTSIWSDKEISGHCVAFSPDGTGVAAGSDHGDIVLFDMAGGRSLGRYTGHKGSVHDLAFRPDGKYLVSASRDGTARLWNIEARQQTCKIDGLSDARRVCYSPDGLECVVGLYSGVGIIYRQKEDALIESNRFAEPTSIGAFRYTPDGKTIAVSSLNRSVKLLDIKSLRVMRELHGHNGSTLDAILSGHTESVSSMAFTPDGSRIATCSSDRTVRVWDVRSKEEVLSLTAETSVNSHVLFSPDGNRLICVNQNTISEWSANDKVDQNPGDREKRRVRWHFSEYNIAERNNHPFAVVQHVSSILASDHVKGKRLAMLDSRSRAWIELGNYDKAIADIESIPIAARKVTPNNMGLFYLLADNTEGYHRVCDEMSKDLTSPNKINNATWLCLLVPEAIHRYPSLKAAATESLDGEDANYLNTLGSMYVLSGDFEKGIVALEKGIAIRGKPDPLDWFFLSLAHQGLEQNEKATKYSMKLHAWLKEQELKRTLGHPTDSTFSKTLELEQELFLAEEHAPH